MTASTSTPLSRYPKYVDLDERYLIAPHYRPAKRGPNDRVRDGWDLTDTFTEVTRWYATREDYHLAITGAQRAMDFVLEHKDRYVAWRATTSTGSGVAELRLVLGDLHGKPQNLTTQLGLVSTRTPDVRLLGVARLLVAVGLEGLPEVTS